MDYLAVLITNSIYCYYAIGGHLNHPTNNFHLSNLG